MLLSSALLVTSVACTFPPYVAGGNASGGGQATSGQAGDGASGGALGGSGGAAGATGGAGSPGTGGSDAEAGAGGSPEETGIVRGWSSAAVDELGFELLGSAELVADGVQITNKDIKNKLGGLVQTQQLDLALEPELQVTLGFRITPGAMNGDGMALIFHASPDGPTRLGAGGGGLAYGGIAPCMAVELDTAEIAAADLPAPHLGLMPACNPDKHGPSTTALGGNPSDGADWSLTAHWSAETGLLDVTLLNEATGRETNLSESMDPRALVGPKLYVAVTAANGEFSATHFVRSLRVGGGGLELRTLTDAP